MPKMPFGKQMIRETNEHNNDLKKQMMKKRKEDENSIAQKVQNAIGSPLYEKASDLELLCWGLLNHPDEYFTTEIEESYFEDAFEIANMLSISIVFCLDADTFDYKIHYANSARDSGFELMKAFQVIFDMQEKSDKNKETEKLIREKVLDLRLTFIAFINDLKQNNTEVDTWGIFNPPTLNVE